MSSFAPQPPGDQPQQRHQPHPHQSAPQPPYGQPGIPAPEAGTPKRKRAWKAPTFIGIGAFVLGTLIGSAGGASSPSADSAPTVAAAGQSEGVSQDQYQALVAERDNLKGQVQQLQDAEAEAKAQAAAPAGLVNGDYIVGQTIEPGRYSMTVTDLGYVDQQNGDDFLAQEVGQAGETMIVDVQDVPGSIVSFQGVTAITKVG